METPETVSESNKVAVENPQDESQPTVSGNLHNVDDFLSRCNWSNEKIHNILKSPPGARQRSVFTANPPSTTKFNVSAAPFVASSTLQQQQKQQEQQQQQQQQQQQHSSLDNIPISSPFHVRQPHVTIPAHFGYSNDGYDHARMMRSLSARYNQTPLYTSSNGFKSAGTDMRPIVIMPGNISPSLSSFPARMSYRDCDNSYLVGPIALSNGTIHIRLREGVWIDMTLDKAVRVFNTRSMVAIALSSNGSSTAMIHPNGRVYQNGSRVEIVTYDGMKSNNYVRYAKMWYKGVSFTSENCALTYLVDTAGTRTTTDGFLDMSRDYTIFVFYNESRHGPSNVQEAAAMVQNASLTCSEDGTETYEINGFRISQAHDGLVKLTRTHNKCLIRTSPTNGSATLTTPAIHCTASLGKTSHMFVRRGEKRMHFDGSCFIVRNAGHSAGFNENNLLIVY